MIELSYKTMHDKDFRQAFQKLSETQVRTPVAMRIKHIVKKISDADVAMQEDFKKTFGGKYFKLNEKGDMIPDPRSPEGIAMVDNEPGTYEKFQESEKEFLARKFTLDTSKLASKTLEEVGTFSAQELIALEPIYVELAEAK